MSAVSTAVGSLVDEIAEVLEPLRARNERRARYTLVERGRSYEIYRNDRTGPVFASQGFFGDLGQDKLPRQVTSQPVEVRLDAGRVLSKALQLPASSRQYLDAIVGHQVERMTPWAADRVVFDYTVDEAATNAEQVSVRLVATSRDVLDAAVERLAGLGVKPALVGTSEDPLDRPSPVNLLQASKLGRKQALRRNVAIALAAIAVAGAAVSGFTGWRLYSLSAEAAAVQAELDEARRAVEEARSRTVNSEAYAKLLARKQGVVAMVVLVDELSKIIPAGTFLSELQIEDQGLRITGFSDDAPALIATLESAAVLKEVNFAAPTTRDEGTSQDRFEIVATIEPPAPPAS